MRKRTPKASEGGSTHDRALVVAIRLIQERGYNGFSFNDIASELGISHVAVHHHFATKADLVVAAVRHYSDAFAAEVAAIEARGLAAADALRAYAQLFQATLADRQRVCLCGMLTAELLSLPASARQLVRRFYERNEEWLAKVLQRIDRVDATGAAALAAAFLSALEGAMLTARAFDDGRRLADAADWLITKIVGPAARPTPATRSKRP
jgi:TetR/AcrR family transcriptional repressor of nem operon